MTLRMIGLQTDAESACGPISSGPASGILGMSADLTSAAGDVKSAEDRKGVQLMDPRVTSPSAPFARSAARGGDRLTELLLRGGMIGPALFVMVLLVEGATRPGYDAWVQAGSALSLSGWGWMQIVNFIICGVLVFGFAIGLHRSLTASGRGSTWGPLLIGAFGLVLVMAGVFVTDPAQGYPPGTPGGPSVTTTWHGAVHAFAGLMVFAVLLPTACYVMAAYFARVAGLRSWALYSLGTGIFLWASFAAFIVAGLHTGPAGLYERIAIIVGWTWIVLLAARLLRDMRPSVEKLAEPDR